jgi:hypothetical protein
MRGNERMRRIGWLIELSTARGVTAPRAVYEALAPLTCARCLGPIAVGERFTRRRSSAAGGPTPVCRACAPFAGAG